MGQRGGQSLGTESTRSKPGSASPQQVSLRSLIRDRTGRFLFPEVTPVRGDDAPGPQPFPMASLPSAPTATFCGETVQEEGGGGGTEVSTGGAGGAEGAVGGGCVVVLVLEVLTRPALCL